MDRKFIPWAGVYVLGAAFIWWLDRAIAHQWPTAEALMLLVGEILWLRVAFHYSFSLGVTASCRALNLSEQEAAMLAVTVRSQTEKPGS